MGESAKKKKEILGAFHYFEVLKLLSFFSVFFAQITEAFCEFQILCLFSSWKNFEQLNKGGSDKENSQ